MDCHHLGGIAWMVWDHMSEPIVARRASAGLVTRLVIAPRGSETMSATAVAVSLTHWVAEEKPDLIEPHTPPSAKAIRPRREPVSPTVARPAPREALTASSQVLPPRARSASGRMMPSPPDRARAPPPSGEKNV